MSDQTETVHSFAKQEGPRVDSDDANERKLARRMRIERRVQKQQKTSTDSIPKAVLPTDPLKFEDQTKLYKKQITRSNNILQKNWKASELDVNKIRLDVHNRELEKRERDGMGKESLIQELEEEARKANNIFEEIAVKWSLTQKFSDPYNMHETIEVQKEKGDALIQQKDEMILRLKHKINNSERVYSKEQRRQVEDIKTLRNNIEKQLSLTKMAYKVEFKTIAEIVSNLKEQYASKNYYKWMDLQKEMSAIEARHSEQHFIALENFQNKQNNIREDFEDVYRERKFQLLTLIDGSRQHFENIKNVALLNSEKLDYNYQILSRREDENIVLKGQQKRRINKLQDVITDLRQRLRNYKTTANNQIKKQSEAIKKLHRSILDIESKADHFSKINDRKFHQLWEINKIGCLELLRKIMSIDKILHEQQMAAYWNPPEQTSLELSTMPSFRKALSILGLVTNPSKKSVALEAYLPKKEETSGLYRMLLKNIFMKLSDKSGFLTEKCLKMILHHYEDEQRSLVTLEHVFQALDIVEGQQMDVMIKYFLPYCYCTVCDGIETPDLSIVGSDMSNVSYSFSMPRADQGHQDSSGDARNLLDALMMTQESKLIIENAVLELVSDTNFHELSSASELSLDMSIVDAAESSAKRKSVLSRRKQQHMLRELRETILCQYHHPLVISCVFVLHALKEFVEAYHTQNESIPTTGERLVKKRLTISRLLDDQDIETYWTKVRSLYDENRSRVWEALLRGLKYYHEVLKERKTVAMEVCTLRKVNADLKEKLARYQDRSILLPPICLQSYSR